MIKDYTQFKIENYILKITGVFNYDKEFLKKAIKSDYQELKFSDNFEKFSKDYFYPDFRKQFFSNDPTIHKILKREKIENSIVDLFEYKYKSASEKSKQLQLKIVDSQLDLFEAGFGLFTLNLKIQSEKIDLSKFSDASYLARKFETSISHPNYENWQQYIDNEILLGSITKGKSVIVDEYSGSKYKLFMVLDIPELDDKEMMKPLLFDIGTLSRIGSAIGNSYDSMDKGYIQQLIENNSISVYNNYEGLVLLDTFTVVGNKILDNEDKIETYSSVYYGIYLYCLFLKYNLFKYSFEIADLDEDKRTNFQDFMSKYYFNYISYNFLPTEIFNKIKTALDIENELQLLNEKIVAIGLKIQEEQQSRTNVILGIVMVLSTLASIQQIQGYIVLVQKWLGLSEVDTISIVVLLVLGIGFFVFGKNILKKVKKLIK